MEDFSRPNFQNENDIGLFPESENAESQYLGTFSAESNQQIIDISTSSDDEIVLPLDSLEIIRRSSSFSSEEKEDILGEAETSVDTNDELLEGGIRQRKAKNSDPGNNKRKAYEIKTSSEDFSIEESVGKKDKRDYYKLTVEETTEIVAKLTDLTGNVDFYLEPQKGKVIDKSRNGGKKDEEITATLEPDTDYYFRVQPRNKKIKNAKYTFDLEIVESPDNLTVTTPNGGENIKAGSTVEIAWDSETKEKVDISLIKNEEWDSFIDVDVSGEGTYTWEVPEDLEVGNKYQVLVETSDSLDSETINFDNSDGFFNILEAEKITLTSLNGGEIIEPGAEIEITWDDNIDDNVNINLFQGNELVETIVSGIPSNGSYNWAVPESVAEGNGYQILIESAVNNEIADTSDGFFAVAIPAPITITSPNGGENLRLGQEYEITWDDNIEGNVTIELHGEEQKRQSEEDPGFYSELPYPIVIASDIPSNGSYTWKVNHWDSTAPIEEDNFKIKIRSVDGEFEDESDDFFNIIFDPDKYFQVLYPNGGETLAYGSTVDISWTHNIDNTDYVGLEIQLVDENGHLIRTIGNVGDSAYSDSWEIPTHLNEGKGGKYKIDVRGYGNYVKIRDTSDDFFTIAPRDYLNVINSSFKNGVYDAGDKIDIQWEDNLDENVVIELYSFNELKQTITDSTPSDGFYTWTVPNNLEEGFYKMRVRSLDGQLADESLTFSVNGFGSHISSAISAGGPLAQSIIENWSETDWNIAINRPVSTWENIEEGGQTAWQAIGYGSPPLGAIQIYGDEITKGGQSAWATIAAGGDKAWQALGKGGFTTNKALALFQKHHPKGETAWATIAAGGDATWEALNQGGLDAWKTLNHVTEWKPQFGIGSPLWSSRWKGSKPTGWDAITRLGDDWVDNAWEALKDGGAEAWNNLSENPTTWLEEIKESKTQANPLLPITGTSLIGLNLTQPYVIITGTTPKFYPKLKPGDRMKITWKSNTEEDVSISIHGDPIKRLLTTKNDGEQEVIIPEKGLEHGKLYNFLVESKKDTRVVDISTGGFRFDNPILEDASIPNQTFKPGERITIKWQDNLDSNVKIGLYTSSGRRVSTITSSTQSDGRYDWRVPDNILKSGETYKFLITSTKDSKISTFTKGEFTYSEKHELISYNGFNIIGTATIHPDFKPAMRKIDNYAKENNVKVYITESFRDQSARGTGARYSNNLVGHAINMNVKYDSNGDGSPDKLCNSSCMSSLSTAPEDVRNFLNDVKRDSSLRWRSNDPFHIDDNLYFDDKKEWQEKFDSLQN